ncbi:ABC transporter ATP-binding protein [Sanguibacter suaedae]|uniref:ABC transporter ATP-binding protein n=1 Tax=Sanguibacter suaedae TaxID=2795737 RepID=A0A934MEI5_9MICO|nr:ABC transporter ATP-binding protein [Sanguibacter suaedae]MBI9115724.1 ABC transporter ATP-binding protein [Sanguibacter suaedae]
MTLLRVVDVHKTYPTSPPIHALGGVDFVAQSGERVAVVGRSGSGKSTFLNIIGLLDVPTTGSVHLMGQDTRELTDAGRDRLRANSLGFVFQENHILGHRTVTENLEIKLAISALPRSSWPDRTSEALERVGLLHRRRSLARLLSGGEKQRLAVARAVISRPRVLLADEPTGNLDEDNADNILSLFDEQAANGVAVIVITHDTRIARWADRTVHLAHGRLTEAVRG